MVNPPRRVRRVAAHVVLGGTAGAPGERVRFGEDPGEVARTAAGLAEGAPLLPYDVVGEVVELDTAEGPVSMHIDRVFYRRAVDPPRRIHHPGSPGPAELLAEEPVPPQPILRRFACYGVVTEPAGRLLLTRISEGYPGGGTWHLPGGGVDHGETAKAALLRELYEESGQRGGVGRLISVSSHHRTGQPGPHSPRTDIHAVWVFFHVHVSHPGEPRVLDLEGSTSEAAWFTPEDLPHLALSTTARRALTLISRG